MKCACKLAGPSSLLNNGHKTLSRKLSGVMPSMTLVLALLLLLVRTPASDPPTWCRHSPFWASFPPKTPSAPGYAPHGEQPLWQPATQGPDGPLAGNGDLGAVIGRGLRGGPFAVYSGKNDLWSGNQAGGLADDADPAKASADWIDSWGYSKLPGAWVELGAPGSNLSSWQGSQDLCRAYINGTASFSADGNSDSTLHTSTFVAAERNMVVTHFTCDSCGGNLHASLWMGNYAFGLPVTADTVDKGDRKFALVTKQGQKSLKNNATAVSCDQNKIIWPRSHRNHNHTHCNHAVANH